MVQPRKEPGLGRPPDNLPAFDLRPATRTVETSGVEIEVIDLRRRRERSRFLAVAAAVNAGDPNYIHPLRMSMMKFLDPGKNPAFSNLEVRPMIAVSEGRDVGRIVAHVDHAYNRHHGVETGFFGFFDSIDDRRVAHALLDDATGWLTPRGCREVFGPLHFSTNHQAGLLVENFDRPPFVEEVYNPPYAEELLTSFGLGKAKDLLVYWIDLGQGLESPNRQRVGRIAERIAAREGATVRQLDRKNVDRDMELMFEIYSHAWTDNWGFSPLSEKEFMWLVEDLKMILIPELFLFVEVEGRPVGFCCTIPNVNEILPKNGRLLPFGWLRLLRGLKKTAHGRLYTLGMLREYRKRGLESILFVETAKRCIAAGFLSGEIGWTLEDNSLVNRAIESMDATVDRRYRIFGAKLG